MFCRTVAYIRMLSLIRPTFTMASLRAHLPFPERPPSASLYSVDVSAVHPARRNRLALDFYIPWISLHHLEPLVTQLEVHVRRNASFEDLANIALHRGKRMEPPDQLGRPSHCGWISMRRAESYSKGYKDVGDH